MKAEWAKARVRLACHLSAHGTNVPSKWWPDLCCSVLARCVFSNIGRNEICYKSNRVDRRSTATSVEDEEQHQLCRMAPTILSAMQVFTAITAIVPRFLPGGGETAEEWAFISMYVLADLVRF